MCKQTFMAIQYRHSIKPLHLLLDMKVRWSSTYVMLTHAESRQHVSNKFGYRYGILTTYIYYI